MRRPTSVLMGFLFIGCAHAPPAPPERHAPSEYYPLAVGNAWTFSGTMLGQTVEQTVTVTGKEGEYFKDSANTLLRVDAFGVRDPKRYLLQRPLTKGATWKSVVGVGSVEHYEIVETDKRLVTLAGAFEDCVVVRSTNRQDVKTELVNEMTFAPGVGIVRIATYANVGGKKVPQVVFELKGYKLASAAAPAKPGG